jgi:hypothetical protein
MVLRIWDVFMLEGMKVVFRVGLQVRVFAVSFNTPQYENIAYELQETELTQSQASGSHAWMGKTLPRPRLHRF